MYSMLLLHVGSGECQNDRAGMNKVPAPRIRRRRTKRLICSCDAEVNPQSVAVDNVVTDPPTEKNQYCREKLRGLKWRKNTSSHRHPIALRYFSRGRWM